MINKYEMKEKFEMASDIFFISKSHLQMVTKLSAICFLFHYFIIFSDFLVKKIWSKPNTTGKAQIIHFFPIFHSEKTVV